MFTSTVARSVFVKVPSALPGPQTVKVGFPAGEADQDNINKAIWNEFGTRGGVSGGGWGGPIPERPFMRNAMRSNQIRYVNAMRSSAAKIVRGETTLGTTMQKLGIFAQGHIQAEITSLMSPSNSPVTIALKGSSKPLIDSGEMRGAVTWKVDR
ncbi:hypothetical protein EHI47_11700 [Rhizobium leguminosarum]|uniref:Uncharacterized protein n=1 Tax=Rhizobium leguminosarum TaxID=384 RepID=A0A444I3T3_RHILE|nr:hypothetical protein [Rhizobium leguminosarum]RWX32039.1 hypothetical protein EHI47_11700 [Rhizobium leguminosarum]